MTPLYVALEGPHGAGKSTLADAFAERLKRDGVDARAFHHAHADSSLTPWQRALYFAQQRADIVAAHQHYAHAPRVVVCDRWSLSTWIDLAAAQDGPLRTALQRLVHAEAEALPLVQIVILDAPDDVLRARLEARGETHDPELAARSRRFARGTGAPIVDTSAPRADVVARLVEIVRGWL